MGFCADSFFHVFNRGINKQKIFFNEENYHYFCNKIEKHLAPHCDILAYCLMPNHFHLLISTNENAHEVSNGLRTLLSSYTRGINQQEKRVGSLFQQNTKKKIIKVDDNGSYLKRVFDYIHNNPVNAKLCISAEDWSFSSYNEYTRKRYANYRVCNTSITQNYIDNFTIKLDQRILLENKYDFKKYE